MWPPAPRYCQDAEASPGPATFAVGAWRKGAHLAVEGAAWRVMERGRDRLCDAVDARLRWEGATADRQASCRVRCLQEARVRCPVVEDPVGRR